MRICIVSLACMLLSGCVSPIRLDVDTRPTAGPVFLAVAEVRLIDETISRPPAAPAVETYPLDDRFQDQFRLAVTTVLTDLVAATGTGPNRAVIRIEESGVAATSHPAKDIVFAGLVACVAGVEETYTASVKGTIEIEEEAGRVVKSARFSCFGSATDKSGTDEEVIRGVSAAAQAALDEMQRNIRSGVKRYLYETGLQD